MPRVSRKNGKLRSLTGSKQRRTLSLSDIELRKGWVETIDNILTDFFANVDRRQKEAKKAHKPPPLMIKSLDDIAKVWEMILFITKEVQECVPQSTYEPDPIMTKLLEEDPEARELNSKLHEKLTRCSNATQDKS
jgi:hypothetical protein